MAVSRVIKLQHHRIAQVRTHTKNNMSLHIKECLHLNWASLPQISVEQWRLPSWVMRGFPFRWMVRPGSNHLESSRSSTRTELRCSPETGWERRSGSQRGQHKMNLSEEVLGERFTWHILILWFSLQAFENTLKSWEDKLKYDKPPLRPHLYPQQSVDLATEEEAALVQMCARAAEELITR